MSVCYLTIPNILDSVINAHMHTCINKLMMQTTLSCTTAAFASLCPPPPPSLRKGSVQRASAAQSFPAGRDCLPVSGGSCITQSQRA